MTSDVGTNRQLKKAIKLRHAVALYVSSVLGSGILVLPGLAAHIAGPASLIAWAVLGIASYPFAFTFATLSARRPEAGGVYGFTKESFGFHAAVVVGWLFAFWYITGAPAATLIAASYLAYAFPMSKLAVFAAAALIMLSAFLINYRGIVLSNRVQLGAIVAILALLIVGIAASIPGMKAASFSPFAPNGWLAIGTAAALIFWSYLGYENVSNVAEEFEDPQRDFKRSIVLSVVLIGALYMAVAAVTIGTRAYLAGGSIAPFAAILSNALGHYGAAGTAVLAMMIIFATANAYTAGMSRVVLAVARDGGLPRWFDRVDPKSGSPTHSLILLSGLGLVALTAYYFFQVDLETALLIPSGAAILVYIIGTAAGARLLADRGWQRIFPLISLVLSVVLLPFVGWAALGSILAGLAAYLYVRLRGGGTPRPTPEAEEAQG